jgi:hypothetical protein
MFWRIVLAAALAAGLSFAQGTMGGGGMNGGQMGGSGTGRGGAGMGGDTSMGGGGMRPQRQSPFEVFADKLKLNKDQKTEALSILQDAAKEIGPVRDQMQQTRQNLAGALISGQTGEPVDQLIKAYAPLASQAAGIEAKAFAKICKMLKPNQEKSAAQAFELLAETLPRMAAGRGGNRSER